MSTPLFLLPKVRSDAIMKSAKDQPCALRIASFIPGRQCHGPATCVGTHLPNFTKGQSTKGTDLGVAYGCFACHDIIDGRDQEAMRYITKHFPAAVMERMLNALVETQARLIEQEIIIVPKARLI